MINKILQLMSQGGNPMEVLNSVMGQNNPMLQQAMKMSEGKNPQEMEQLLKNLCQQKGMDFGQFMSQYSGIIKT